jgi:hypothetical protein
MANRSINQNAQARGLGNSGLKDLSLVQSQLAQGRAVNDVEQTGASVQRAAMGTKLSLQEQLQNAMNAAESNYGQNKINADRMAYEMDVERQNKLRELYEMGIAGATPEQIKAMASIYNIDMSSLSPELSQAFGDLTPQTQTFKGKGSFFAEAGGALTRLIANVGSLGTYNNPEDSREISSDDRFANSFKFTYNVDGVDVKMTPVEMANHLRNKVYKGDEDLSNGNIKLYINNRGDITFYANGQQYARLSDAKKALK